MTLLEEIIPGNAHFKYYEAPLFTSTKIERFDWIYNERPFFEQDIFDFWELYNRVAKAASVSLNIDTSVETDERRRFIQRPVLVVTVYGAVVGGVWLDSVSMDKKINGKKLAGKCAQVHLTVDEEYRHLAYDILEAYMHRLRTDYVSLAWGRRTARYDPSAFLRSCGFTIEERICGGVAYCKTNGLVRNFI